MDLIDKNGYTFNNIEKVNFILGKNGCGKSTALKKVQQALERDESIGKTKYITPERGGTLKYNPNIEANITNNPKWINNELRKNQFSSFKEHTVIQFRKLELLFLREIEMNKELRSKHEYTFDSEVNKVNALLDNVVIHREGADFKIFDKNNIHTEIPADSISSGESELISLGIECLVFARESIPERDNILFLDEPDAHLHPDLQVRLALFLKDLVEHNDFKVIIATHSTSFLGAFNDYPSVAIDFMVFAQTEINFKKVSEEFEKIIPVFGAHPLSNIFNESPIFLVEGEDDLRIWQQAIRTSNGNLKIYPCSVDSINHLDKYEKEVCHIINSIYESAKAYSLRDKDDGQEEINDLPPVTRMRLSCRAAENLLLSDDVLNKLNTNWNELKSKIDLWLERNQDHHHYNKMNDFKNSGYDRKNFKLKKIRNDLMGILANNKPWEIIVGQSIGKLTVIDPCSDNSLQAYLGQKLIENIF